MSSVKSIDLKRCIFNILNEADLSTISSKIIRKRCEEYFGIDLTSRKKEIDDIAMAYTSKKDEHCGDSDDADSGDEGCNRDGDKGVTKKKNSEANSSDNESKPSLPKTPKYYMSETPAPFPECLLVFLRDKEKAQKDSLASSEEKDATKKDLVSAVQNDSRDMKDFKKNKKSKMIVKKELSSDEDKNDDCDSDDEALARQLQDEEWNLRSRPSRRGTTRKTVVKRKKNENSEKIKERKGTSAYSRKCLLSADLAEIMESNEMARSDVVKRMWSIIRERNLFDPSNKQFALCDEQLLKVFNGKKRIRIFGMMKYLKNHIKDLS